jgi:integrase
MQSPMTIWVMPCMELTAMDSITIHNLEDHIMRLHSGWDHLVREAREAAGVASLTAYALRHTWTTDALTQGVDPMTIAQIGSSSLSMISRTYGDLLHGHAEKSFAGVVSL